MSNDSKLWAWRGVVALCLLVDAWLLTSMMAEAIKLSDPHASTHLVVRAVLFFAAMLLNLPVYIFYMRAKNARWETPGVKEQARIDVETLAAYAKQEEAEKAAWQAKQRGKAQQKR